MDCLENCWILSPPTLPPAPPVPQFLAYLNLTIDCDLCSWAGVKMRSSDAVEPNVIQLSSLLIIVGVISAGCGAGIMAAILSIKRIRSNSASSVRHLARKESSRNRSAVSGEAISNSAFAENTYCDAPYSAGPRNDKDLSSNIYAELQEPRIDTIWTRPRTSPPIENCYLELADLPTVPARPPPLATQCLPAWFLEESPNSSSYYSDFAKPCASANYQS